MSKNGFSQGNGFPANRRESQSWLTTLLFVLPLTGIVPLIITEQFFHYPTTFDDRTLVKICLALAIAATALSAWKWIATSTDESKRHTKPTPLGVKIFGLTVLCGFWFVLLNSSAECLNRWLPHNAGQSWEGSIISMNTIVNRKSPNEYRLAIAIPAENRQIKIDVPHKMFDTAYAGEQAHLSVVTGAFGAKYIDDLQLSPPKNSSP